MKSTRPGDAEPGGRDRRGYGTVRPAVLTVQEAAVYLSISVATLYRLVRTGDVPHTRVGGSLRFRLTDLESYLEANTSRTWRKAGRKERGDVRPSRKPR